MMYLSKGILCKRRDQKTIWVRRLGQPMQLSGAEAATWLNGRLGFAIAATPAEENVVQSLRKKWLIEYEPSHDTSAQYWILTRCVLLPIQRVLIRFPPLNRTEKIILTWLKKAGMHLGVSELVYLFENGIRPSPELLFERNRLALCRKIYPCRVSIAHQMESKMQHAMCRYEIVKSIMSLVRRKRIIVN